MHEGSGNLLKPSDLLLNSIEETGVWPDFNALVMIVLLPKPDGGLRPIGLLSTYTRVWMRCRRYNIATWRAANQRKYLFGGKGKGAQRAAWMQAVRAETAKLSNETY